MAEKTENCDLVHAIKRNNSIEPGWRKSDASMVSAKRVQLDVKTMGPERVLTCRIGANLGCRRSDAGNVRPNRLTLNAEEAASSQVRLLGNGKDPGSQGYATHATRHNHFSTIFQLFS